MTQTYAANKANYYYGRGRVNINVHNPTTDALTYWAWMGNVNMFEFTPREGHAILRSSYSNDSGVLADAMIERDWDFSLKCNEWNFENLRSVLAGLVAFYTQTNTPVTADPLTSSSVKGGRYYPGSKKRRGTAITVKDDGVAATLGSDYTVQNAETMEIYVVPTGTIADGSVLTMDWTPTTISGTALPYITVGTLGTVNCSLKIDLSTPSAGPPMYFDVWSAALEAKDVLGLIMPQGSTNFAEFSLSGKALSDAAGTFGGSATDPYIRVWQGA